MWTQREYPYHHNQGGEVYKREFMYMKLNTIVIDRCKKRSLPGYLPKYLPQPLCTHQH